jgi:hypothetical protein
MQQPWMANIGPYGVGGGNGVTTVSPPALGLPPTMPQVMRSHSLSVPEGARHRGLSATPSAYVAAADLNYSGPLVPSAIPSLEMFNSLVRLSTHLRANSASVVARAHTVPACNAPAHTHNSQPTHRPSPTPPHPTLLTDSPPPPPSLSQPVAALALAQGDESPRFFPPSRNSSADAFVTYCPTSPGVALDTPHGRLVSGLDTPGRPSMQPADMLVNISNRSRSNMMSVQSPPTLSQQPQQPAYT